MNRYTVRTHRSDEPFERDRRTRLAHRRGRRRSGPRRGRRGRHGRQSGDRQRGRLGGLAVPRTGRRRPWSGAVAPAAGRRTPGSSRVERGGHRRPVRAGVGGLGERRRRARAGLPRHLPGRRVLASGRQHPADPRRRPARRSGWRGACARDRDRIRDPDRPGEGDQPARAQDRPRRPSRPVGRSGHRHAARAAGAHHLSGDRAGAPHDNRDAPVAQGADLHLEGVRAGFRREDGGRGRRSGDPRPDQPRPDLGGRGRCHRLAVGRTGCALRGDASRHPARPSAPSWTRTRRSTPPSIRRRPGSTWRASSASSGRSCATRSGWYRSCCTPATTRTT